MKLRVMVAVPCIALCLAMASGEGRAAGPVRVELEKTSTGFRLLRDGKPYFVKGAGGSGPLELLKSAGGNSNRTWAADNITPILDKAQSLGLTITVGVWLGHERHGFNYTNADQVAGQIEHVRKSVEQYKDHPALLIWALGNEMEGYGKGDNAAIWSAINNLAVLVKKLDPNHPTMTVISEIGGDRVKNINRLCPDIDIIGINAYGGGPSIPERYKAAGGVKPYIITEYGPYGVWESGKTSWGAPVELTSAGKADAYRQTYRKAIANQPLCLGGYAFTWGHKQEATATWYGMLLPDGSRLASVDAHTELWTGKPAANLCPRIDTLKLDGPDKVDPGASVRASLKASDPEADKLTVEWVLQGEAGETQLGGDHQAAPPLYPQCIVKAGADSAELRMPSAPGGYRLYVYVRDGKGGAAVANIPMLVTGTVKPAETPKSMLPFVVYSERDSGATPYVPTGWMGSTAAIKMDEGSTVQPHAGKTCIRCDYTAGDGWGGVVWQNPENDWGDKPGGFDLTGAKRLSFWARGDKGGEVVSFLYGLIGKDKTFSDSASGKLDSITLSAVWKQYAIDLTGKDLTRIKSGFAWTVGGQGGPITFYLDDIRYE